MVDYLILAIQHSAAAGVLACLISESGIAAPLRAWVNDLPKNWVTVKLAALLLCPICLSFWLAIPELQHGDLYHYLFIVGLSNAWIYLILKVYEALDAIGDDVKDEVR